MIVIASGEPSSWWSARGEHVGAAHARAETLSKFGLAMEILKNLERWLETERSFQPFDSRRSLREFSL
jgi:hypothetical protein